MPELPEVATVINNLKQTSLINKKIKEVDVFIPKVVKNASINEFKKFFIDEKIKDIVRKGKYLIFELTNNKYWVVHLRMEGKLFYFDKFDPRNKKHLMANIIFNDKSVLSYYDSRMFGTFNIYYSKDECFNSKELKKVAIDPLDEQFDASYLFNKIHKVNRAIKTTILDQTIVSGIGNIYADEILYVSKIHPNTKSNKITLNECKLIVKNASSILKKAIKCHGTTIFSFKFDASHSGGYQKYLMVHSNQIKFCKKCNQKIHKIKVNGRGTYYCPGCQMEK